MTQYNFFTVVYIFFSYEIIFQDVKPRYNTNNFFILMHNDKIMF